MEKKTISIIVPCYNVEQYIGRCLDSLINQDIDVLYEIVVVDDGTKDKSAEIAEEYAIKYPHLIRVLHKQNGGLSSARNYGIKNSDSEFLCFVDSDDYVSVDYLSILYDGIVIENADISMCGIIRTTNSDGTGKRFDSGFNDSFVSDDIELFLKMSSFAAWNKMYKRSLFEDKRFPEGINYEDYALVPQLIYSAKRIAYNHKVGVYYYVNPNSIIMSMKGKVDWNILRAYEVLSGSEISVRKDILEILYIRRVITSLVRTIINVGKKEDLKKIYSYTITNLPNIAANPYIGELKFVDRLIVRSFINNHLITSICIQRIYVFLYQSYNLMRRICS